MSFPTEPASATTTHALYDAVDIGGGVYRWRRKGAAMGEPPDSLVTRIESVETRVSALETASGAGIIVSAGSDRTVAVDESFRLTGTAESTNDDIVSVRWLRGDAEVSSGYTLDDVIDAAQGVTFRFEATDSRGAVASDEVVVTATVISAPTFTSHSEGDTLAVPAPLFSWSPASDSSVIYELAVSATPFSNTTWRQGELAHDDRYTSAASFQSPILPGDGEPRYVQLRYSRARGVFFDPSAGENIDVIFAEGRFVNMTLVGYTAGGVGGSTVLPAPSVTMTPGNRAGVALPSVVGAEITEPDTGVTIRCVSDEGTVRHVYAGVTPTNADTTRYLLHDDDAGSPRVYDMDGTFVRELLINGRDHWWSFTDPDVVYALNWNRESYGDFTLVRVAVSTGVVTEILDFPSNGYSGWLNVGGSSNAGDWDDRYVSIHALDGYLGHATAILLIDMKLGQIVHTLTPHATRGASNSASPGGSLDVSDSRHSSVVSGDGQYLTVGYGHIVYEMQTIAGIPGGTITLTNRREIGVPDANGDLVVPIQSHALWSTDANGDAVWLQENIGGLLMIRASDLAAGILPSVGNAHPSGATAQLPGFASHYNYHNLAGHLGDGRIELVPLAFGSETPTAHTIDGGKAVVLRAAQSTSVLRPFAFHRSMLGDATGLPYYRQPQVAVSQDGKRVFWVSDQRGLQPDPYGNTRAKYTYMAWKSA